jgi:predicted enzyme related to lactoylglutathione lyase
MARVMHFEIPADDPNRAVKFYEKVFGWKIDKWEGGDYWIVTTGEDEEPGINGAIMPKQEGSMVVRNTITVDSFDEYIEKIKSEGGKMLRKKLIFQVLGNLLPSKTRKEIFPDYLSLLWDQCNVTRKCINFNSL